MIGSGFVFLAIIMVIGGIMLLISDNDFEIKIGSYEGSAGFLLILLGILFFIGGIIIGYIERGISGLF